VEVEVLVGERTSVRVLVGERTSVRVREDALWRRSPEMAMTEPRSEVELRRRFFLDKSMYKTTPPMSRPQVDPRAAATGPVGTSDPNRSMRMLFPQETG
jgi:hypothetical protein